MKQRKDKEMLMKMFTIGGVGEESQVTRQSAFF